MSSLLKNIQMSNYETKGISVNQQSAYAQAVLSQRDEFIRTLLALYEKNQPITEAQIGEESQSEWAYDLWISIMETENILNPLPGRQGQYSLFASYCQTRRWR